ncbi:alpha/beta hydrolase [Microbacterium timonense]|uniref:alpha/beta hydrolase n=1 Tax=Microbacterium timonense TaxID=2086576 RepID=UPI001357468C|nr:alpha/beta hydrolase [Microbacterium timonense]
MVTARSAVNAAAVVSPRRAAALALPLFAHVARPRPVHADDEPTMSRARRGNVHIPGVDGRGVDVDTYEWGRGSRVVVLAHGWDGRASQFSRLVRELVSEGHRVVAFDAPAHGGSAGHRTYLVDWLSVFGRLQERHGDFHAIVGHSFGGLAALVGVAGGTAARRVVTIAAPADADLLLTQFQGMLGYSDTVAAQVRERFARRYFPGEADPFAWLSSVRRPLPAGTPLLVAHDVGDRVVPFSEAARIAHANPGGRLLSTNGLGHNRILGADEVLDAVLDHVSPAEIGSGPRPPALEAADVPVSRGEPVAAPR